MSSAGDSHLLHCSWLDLFVILRDKTWISIIWALNRIAAAHNWSTKGHEHYKDFKNMMDQELAIAKTIALIAIIRDSCSTFKKHRETTYNLAYFADPLKTLILLNKYRLY